MNVSEAVSSRLSVRAFLDTPVSDEVMRDLLEKSARAPSGGNLQPWRVFVLNEASIARLQTHLREAEQQKTAGVSDLPQRAEIPLPRLKI